MSHTINKRHSKELRRLAEVNYALLASLAPDLHTLPKSAVSCVENFVDLHLRILERTRYTTALVLTHHFRAGEALISAPELWVRVYHDACVAEPIPHMNGSSPAHTRAYTWNKALDNQVKWKLNNFMEKWLRQCLEMGHHFEPAEVHDEGAALTS